MKELIKSRKKKNGALKVEKNKAKINDFSFDLSDDESQHSRTKKVSFLKTQRISSSFADTTSSESREKEPPNFNQNSDYSNSQHSTNDSEESVQPKSRDVGSYDSQITKEGSSKSLSYQTSGDTLLDLPLPLPSDNSVTETPEEKSSSPQTPQFSATDLRQASLAGLFALLLS